MEARVVMRELTPRLAVTMPLNTPTTPPASTPLATPSTTLFVAVVARDATTPANATIEATDRSTSPSASTSAMLGAIVPISVMDRARPLMFRIERKSGTVSDRPMSSSMSTSARPEGSAPAARARRRTWVGVVAVASNMLVCLECVRVLLWQGHVKQTFLGGVGALDGAYDRSEPHHGDAIADRDDLGEIARHDDDAAAGLGDVIQDGVDFRAGADIDSAGGLIHDQEVYPLRQPAGQNDLLLVATRQRGDRRVAIASAYAQFVDVFVGERGFAHLVQHHAAERVLAPYADVDIVGDAGQGKDGFRLAVLGAKRDAVANGGSGIAIAYRAILEHDGPAVRSLGAAAQREMRRRGQPRAGERLHLEQRLAHLPRAVAVNVVDGASGHLLHQLLLGQLADARMPCNASAVAEHRDRVA